MNKKANFGFILLFFVLIAILLVVSFFIAISIGVIDTVADVVIPEIENIGMVGDSNITQYTQYGTQPVSILINSFTWMGGLAYMIAIIGLFGLAVTYRMTMNRLFIAIFFALAILLIIMSILMSNIYEDIYTGTDEFGTKMKEQTMMSYLILHSPMVFTVVIFISGIVLFSGIRQEEFI